MGEGRVGRRHSGRNDAEPGNLSIVGQEWREETGKEGGVGEGSGGEGTNTMKGQSSSNPSSVFCYLCMTIGKALTLCICSSPVKWGR